MRTLTRGNYLEEASPWKYRAQIRICRRRWKGPSKPLETDEKIGMISEPLLECSSTLYSPGSSSLSHHCLGASPPGARFASSPSSEADLPPPVEMLYLGYCGEPHSTPESESAAPLSVWPTRPDAHILHFPLISALTMKRTPVTCV